MAILTLKIEEADKEVISALAKASELHAAVEQLGLTAQKIFAAENAVIIADRTRAVEQVKRLYAVIVGFSTITFLTGAITCLRALNATDRIEAYGILLSQSICFFTLLILFVFGAERLLDLRYLQQNSPVPAWQALFGDVVCVLFTASWFAILANMLPVAVGTPPLLGLPELEKSQELFVSALAAIYLADVIVLWMQARRFSRESVANSEAQNWNRYHTTWKRINLVMLLVTALLLLYLESGVVAPMVYLKAPQEISVNAVSLILGVAHILRFLFDVARTYPFYYPVKPLIP